ncbi:MAG: hypothetical protein G3M78_02995 [Candidatus Nitrohelix vancouverensis]|uniref:Uncharacterized protein n=1 Tax=Candidatus Nitrohelix vancouverensis TaxID=2705534 RepID=A0A7T0C0R9_9BACT|nr:MAG: hypothetical protein G3M78_02995 [Candidatus Nitrohelix vancouverensis]
MTLSITPLPRVFKSYQIQERYGELNKKVKVKTVQGQVDTVKISAKARELLEKGPVAPNPVNGPLPMPPQNAPATETAEKKDEGFKPFDFSQPAFQS